MSPLLVLSDLQPQLRIVPCSHMPERSSTLFLPNLWFVNRTLCEEVISFLIRTARFHITMEGRMSGGDWAMCPAESFI
jgi:hypothetical protein